MNSINYNDQLKQTPIDIATYLGITVQALHKYIKELNMNTLVAKRKHRITAEQVRQIVSSKGIKYKKQVINFHNFKGGVGKTTLAHSTSLLAASLGFKTLVIDLDAQANLTKSFGLYLRSEQRPTLKSLIFGTFRNQKISLEDTTIPLHDFLDFIPSDMSNANFDLELTLKSAGSGVNSFFNPIFNKLREIYDVIILDSPPAVNSITLGATFNSDKLVIPCDPDDFSTDGAEQVFQQLTLAKSQGSSVRPLICINKISQARSYDMQKVADISNIYGDFILKSTIPLTSKYKEHIDLFKNVWNHGDLKKKPDAIVYLNAAVSEILELDEWHISSRKAAPQPQGEIYA